MPIIKIVILRLHLVDNRVHQETLIMSKHIDKKQKVKKNHRISYSICEEINEKWFQSLGRLNSINDDNLRGIKNIIKRCSLKKIICYAKDRDKIVGTVLGVIENGYLGIYNLIVDLNRRREGIGEDIMLNMIDWAYNNNLEAIYLAVEKENIGALNLYNKLKFTKKYSYRYYQKIEDC